MSRRSGSMSGRWKRGMAWLVRHRQPKGPATDRPRLLYRATSRLYPVLSVLSKSLSEAATLARAPATPDG